MARYRDTGSIFDALERAKHHIRDADKVFFILRVGGIESAWESLEYRLGLVREQIDNSRVLLEKIKEVAEKREIAEIKELLGQKFEFGHVWEKAPDPPNNR